MRRISGRMFNKLGIQFLDFASMLGRVTQLIVQTSQWIARGAVDTRTTVQQMIEIGINSSPVIGLSSLFTGMVWLLQVVEMEVQDLRGELY